MPEMTCGFCQSYENRRRSRCISLRNDEEEVIREDCCVSLVFRTTRIPFREEERTTTEYDVGGLNFNLNFCPECGRDLRRRSK